MKLTPAALKAAVNGDIENFIAASTPGGIEAQEAAGQNQFVVEQTLPKECPREELEKLGFVFGEEADDIFIYVQFPAGWKKEATDHSMWSDLIDNKGRKRGGIFYKAAFYDRNAHMSLNTRYSIGQDYDLKDAVQYVVTDCGNVIHRTEKTECESYSADYWKAADSLEKAAKAWINKEFPKWKDKTAYWD